jgi:hypothetical protein
MSQEQKLSICYGPTPYWPATIGVLQQIAWYVAFPNTSIYQDIIQPVILRFAYYQYWLYENGHISVLGRYGKKC